MKKKGSSKCQILVLEKVSVVGCVCSHAYTQVELGVFQHFVAETSTENHVFFSREFSMWAHVSFLHIEKDSGMTTVLCHACIECSYLPMQAPWVLIGIKSICE